MIVYNCNGNTEDVDAKKDCDFESEASLIHKRYCLKKIRKMTWLCKSFIKSLFVKCKKVILSNESRDNIRCV